MFELRLERGGYLLKKVLDPIKDLLNNANFKFSSSGLCMNSADSASYAFVSLFLSSEGFDHYRCDRSVTMGFNLTNVAKLLRFAANEDTISILANDDVSGNPDKATFVFHNPIRDHTTICDMYLMDIDSDELSIMEEDHDAVVTMPSAEFAAICRDLSGIGNTVVVSVKEEGIRFTTRSEIGSASFLCRPNGATVVEVRESAVASFALRFINSFTKTTPVSEQVRICMSADQPLLIEYKVAEIGYIKFFLASKVEDEFEA